MKLKELYKKSIERSVNPAVSATNFDPKVQEIEIDEYVFTDEIINGLYRILEAVKNNKPYNHVGIWIDGYYGSGKSHFLKYLDYCIKPDTREKALQRLTDAVKAIDPMDDSHNIRPTYTDIMDVANWLKKATIDTCIFNLETSYDSAIEKKQAFHHIFWNEFNGKRGLNKFNLFLAQHLEKPLQEKGVFEQFKQRIADEMEGDWDNPTEAADIIDQELGMVLDIAKDLAPSLDTESIRERMLRRDTNISIDRFCMEIASYIKDKGDDYRFIFFVDEVSQFINKEKDRFLNMQEVITKLSERCENKVWAALTSQQDLSEVMDDCQVAEAMDPTGKTMGRFEVKVSLKGTQPEVITQQRILDKKPEVKPVLSAMYKEVSPSFGLQFKLPNSYNVYASEKAFVDYYPFVPYQFPLIMQVFNSFLRLGYVAKEVKGNERSIIKVIHATAKNNKEEEVGKFISFDELYNNMFEEGLQARGQKAIESAVRMARSYSDNPKLAVRVANVLFMVCNISPEGNRGVFPATLDNITTLLINDVKTPRLTIKKDVEKVIDYLCDNNIIRREAGENGLPEKYSFYTEEEMKVAQLIKSQQVDINTQAEQLRDIFFKYLNTPKNKEQYLTRSFSVGVSIMLRTFLANNNPDVVVEFAMDTSGDPANLAVNNTNNRLVYFVGPLYNENKRLKSNFYWYCQVQRYMATPVVNEDNTNTRKEFEKRAQQVYNDIIYPEFKKILDTCPIISGLTVIDDSDLGNKKGAERYHLALQKHLSNIYFKAKLIDRQDVSRTTEDLKKAILRNVNSGDYDGWNASLPAAEKEVEIYLGKQYPEVNVSDVLHKFSTAPYGWDNIGTLYIINELVRRHKRDYSFSNNPNVETPQVAARIVNETNKFTLREAKAISQDVINNFINAWKEIFGMSEAFATTDSTQLFRLSREESDEKGLRSKVKHYEIWYDEIGKYPFASPIKQVRDMFEGWLSERDPLKYFNAVITQSKEAAELMDTCKEVIQFKNDQMENYLSVIIFVKDNADNFQFLPSEFKPKVEEIKGLENRNWPISMRSYIQTRNVLASALEDVKKEIRQKIETAYNETFDLLEKSATEQGVDTSILPKRDAVIHARTASNNILALQNNLNTDSFYAEQCAKIATHTTNNGKTASGEEGTKVAEAFTLPLSTRTTSPLSNEQDVDAYLARLKKQIMSVIQNGQSVIIIK